MRTEKMLARPGPAAGEIFEVKKKIPGTMQKPETHGCFVDRRGAAEAGVRILVAPLDDDAHGR